jgi:hypothetical protein
MSFRTDRAQRGLIRNLTELKKIPGSPLTRRPGMTGMRLRLPESPSSLIHRNVALSAFDQPILPICRQRRAARRQSSARDASGDKVHRRLLTR